MDEIIDHKSDGSSVKKDDGFVKSPNGNRTHGLTAKGWKLLVQWKYGTSNWIPVKDLKDTNPIETAEYAVTNEIAEEPAVAWWV
jgi:hypothetical protein